MIVIVTRKKRKEVMLYHVVFDFKFYLYIPYIYLYLPVYLLLNMYHVIQQGEMLSQKAIGKVMTMISLAKIMILIVTRIKVKQVVLYFVLFDLKF